MAQRLFSIRLALLLLLFGCTTYAQEMQAYDPLRVSDAKVTFRDMDLNDPARKRVVPVRVYRPPTATAAPCPVVLFSHGLGGSRRGMLYFAEHLARRGYIAVFLQHAGSDESVHKGLPMREKLPALKKAVNLRSSMDRIKDVHFVLDELARLNNEPDSPLSGTMNLEAVAMSGHSFGGTTTQQVSGQWNPFTRQTLSDKRIRAAIVMSPNPAKGRTATRAFANVKRPWLLLTGTKDGSPISNMKPEERKSVYAGLPTGDKYQLVLHGAEHHAFSAPPDQPRRRTHHENDHRAILAVSTAFLDAYLRDDSTAKAWMQNREAVGRVLKEKDAWEFK